MQLCRQTCSLHNFALLTWHLCSSRALTWLHQETGEKYPLADYALTPHMAIIDPHVSCLGLRACAMTLGLHMQQAHHAPHVPHMCSHPPTHLNHVTPAGDGHAQEADGVWWRRRADPRVRVVRVHLRHGCALERGGSSRISEQRQAAASVLTASGLNGNRLAAVAAALAAVRAKHTPPVPANPSPPPPPKTTRAAWPRSPSASCSSTCPPPTPTGSTT